ncbi:MAG: FAD-dependent oxidoreductase [Jatrophihabitans sp.]
MKQTHYRVVVIGGGVVGASVLYHLAKLGWSDLLLVERSELTAGSTWHAAAGFHTLNGDPNVAALQKYTIDLYAELEAETGQSCGLHMTGGINLAGTPERWEWLQSQWAMFQTIGNETVRLVEPDEIKALCPIVDVHGIYGGMYDTYEGHLDASGATFAYAAGARNGGAEIVLHNRVVELHQRPGGWAVVTEHGTITADHVVNAGGLWARKVGHLAGVDLPVAPLEHHYLVTERIPEVADHHGELPMMMDLEGFTYLRQEGQGLLLGVYELDPRHWHVEGAPWDFGMRLLAPDVDRIAPELEIGLSRFPCLETAGIKTWVNGAFTFTPDGNPLVGPVGGLPGFWVACGVMAGFSQGGGVGLALAQWMVNGEPDRDVFGMDVARYGSFASADGYLKATTRQFYQRRFVMTYPNEQLPAGRPLKTSAIHEQLVAQGAHFAANWGLETPRYFIPDDPDFRETPSLRHSNAFDVVAAEVRATRTGVGLLDTTAFARYAITGPGARAWLDRVLAGVIPEPGRIRLTPMLSASGRLTGDLTTTCWAQDEYWVMGSYYLRAWHLRWFRDRLPEDGSVTIEDISDRVAGVSLSGPQSLDLLSRLTAGADDLRWLHATELDLGPHRVRVGRLSVTGELGYELNLPATELAGIYRLLHTAADGLEVVPLGYEALDVLRLEKSFGIWSREFTWAYTPGMSGLDRFVAFDKPAFEGRDAVLRERDRGAEQRLVTLAVDSVDAEARTFDPIWSGPRRVGFVTSGGYGHSVGMSLALGYVDRHCAQVGSELVVHVVGQRTTARVIADSPHDPAGVRPRVQKGAA